MPREAGEAAPTASDNLGSSHLGRSRDAAAKPRDGASPAREARCRRRRRPTAQELGAFGTAVEAAVAYARAVGEAVVPAEAAAAAGEASDSGEGGPGGAGGEAAAAEGSSDTGEAASCLCLGRLRPLRQVAAAA